MSRSIGALILLGLLALGTYQLIRTGTYGLTVFVLIPVIVGALAAWVFPATTGMRAMKTGGIAVGVGLLLFFLAGWEGAICIAMAAPLGIPLGGVGGWIVYRLRQSNRTASSAAMLLLMPVTIGWDVTAKPPIFQVHSSIEIAAPPEKVWTNVVSFSDLPEPTEWFFRAGVAYPKRAHIDGSGPGAIRYCEFSTGPFVEPIQLWDEPHLLRFSVTENPAPMNELSPYSNLVPKHLHGYLISKQGQFQLTPLPNGHTLLEGTTWYQHGLWPSQYWSWWSGAIIHRIHLRVLNHIKTLSESEGQVDGGFPRLPSGFRYIPTRNPDH